MTTCYDDEVSLVHANAIKDGIDERTWEMWRLQARIAVKKCGFASSAQVRRAADKFAVNRPMR